MSLRVRLVLVVVVLNLAVVAVMQVGSAWIQNKQLKAQQDFFLRVLQMVLEEFYPTSAAAREQRWVRDVLRQDTFRRVFRDVMISSGAAAQGIIDLNPMGAAHRDAGFSTDAVHRGILRAKAEQRPVPVGAGFCVPIETGGEVDVGAWYVPAAQQPAPIPLAWFALPLLLGTALIAVLAYFGLGRSVVQPLDQVGRAAARLGAGEHDVRVAHVGLAPELAVLVDAFNAMAAKVVGHADELRREVAKATEETARRERALVVSARLAAMGTLAAGIAHEINNPIAGMMNAAHRLLQRGDLDERSRVYLTLILDGLDRVGAITRRVLDFSPRQIAAAPFRLADAVDGARQLVAHRCHTEGVELRTELPADLPDVVGDRHELQQVFLNFFLNSLDVLAGRAPPRWIAVRAERAGDAIAVTVDDNGPGVDAATLARVLDPFFSAKGDPTASGLGLFISYSIIKNHGGEMEVDAAPDQGFHVRLRLPARAG